MPRRHNRAERRRAPQDVLASHALCVHCAGRAFEIDGRGRALCPTHADLQRLPVLLLAR